MFGIPTVAIACIMVAAPTLCRLRAFDRCCAQGQPPVQTQDCDARGAAADLSACAPTSPEPSPVGRECGPCSDVCKGATKPTAESVGDLLDGCLEVILAPGDVFAEWLGGDRPLARTALPYPASDRPLRI